MQNLEEAKGYVLEAILLAVVFIYLILIALRVVPANRWRSVKRPSSAPRWRTR